MGPVCTKPQETVVAIPNTTKPVSLRDLPSSDTTQTLKVTPAALEVGVKASPPADDLV